MRKNSTTALGWLAPLSLFLLAACVSPATRSESSSASTDAGGTSAPEFRFDGAKGDQDQAESGKDSEEGSLAEKLAEVESELLEAEMEARIGSMKGEQERAEARHAVTQAELAVGSKRDELAAFREVEGPHIQAKGALDVMQAETRLEAARQDLEGILEIYEGEEEARAKQEIIRRNRVAVDIAAQRLENERVALRLDTEFEVPRKVRELEAQLADAEFELRSAEAAVAVVELESEASAQKIAMQIEKFKRKQAKLQAQMAARKPKAKSAASEE